MTERIKIGQSIRCFRWKMPVASSPYWRRLLAAVLVSSTSACAHGSTRLGIVGSEQQLPMPAFFASDESNIGSLPRYSQIRVYQLDKSCKVPHCPIVWDVVVGSRHAPAEFIYGGFPGFGAQTVIPARPLLPGKQYLLVTMPDKAEAPYGRGQFRFEVTEAGKVVAANHSP